MPKNSLLITAAQEFMRAINGDETRYFPQAAPESRRSAVVFAADHDFTTVTGFAVYDTTVSTSYAVALYATKAEAEAHEPTPAPEKPTDIFPGAADGPKPRKPR